MSNLPSNSLQEGEHNLQEMKTKSPAWSSKGYHMYELTMSTSCSGELNKRAMMALGHSPEYHWNQLFQNLSTGLPEEVV